MQRILLRCFWLAVLLVYLPVLAGLIQPLLWVDMVLVVYLWLLFHPLHPLPWVWRIGWLVIAQSLAPVLTFGAYLAAGLITTATIRFLQRSYVVHTHPVTFLSLLVVGTLVWEIVLQSITAISAIVIHTPSLFLPIPVLAIVITREMMIVACLAGILLLIRAWVLNTSIQDSLRQYYEHLQEPHLHTSGQSTGR